MVIRAGVDDRQMTSALGVNIQLTFAIAFVVGSALAGLRRRSSGRSQGAVAPGQDGQWLLNSLVVVIIGGMGSLARRRGRLAALRARRSPFSAVYLPTDRRQLLHPVLDRLHLRAARARARVPAAGPLREIRRDARSRRPITRARDRRSASLLVVARSRPLLFNALLGRHDPHADADPRHRRREPDLPLRLRRDGLARADGADGHRRLHRSGTWSRRRRGGESKGLTLGWDPTLALVLAIVGHDADRAPLRRARRAEHGHLLPDDHAHLRGDRASTSSAR